MGSGGSDCEVCSKGLAAFGGALAMRPLLISANDRKVLGHPQKKCNVFNVPNIVSGGVGGVPLPYNDAWDKFYE